ncbi:MAG: phage tail protein I [Hyphomicrobiaceae bacterium]|nr:phage tail protein I [Hyphomicrobiaceae bacterium]
MVDVIETPRAEHLLPYDPRDATPLEVAISGADARLLAAPSHLIRAVWSPDDCPVHLLPYLAAAWSVDHWNPAWPESVKREVIRRAPEIHRLKGTRRAMQRALDALGVKTLIKEWFEQAPAGEPYTFAVTAYPTARLFGDADALITPQLTRDILETIKSVKPVSRWFSFEIGVGSARDLAAVARYRQIGAPHVPQVARPRTDAGSQAAAVARVRSLGVATVGQAARPLVDLVKGAAAVCRVRSLGFVAFSMEASPA